MSATSPVSPTAPALPSEITRAHNLAWHRRRIKPHFKISAESWTAVILALQQRWSPEQICYRRKLAGLSAISPESVYQRIWQDKA